ncbi:MAG: aldehyde dehydrogenase [Candidatus Eremiobacteraeota bacterium]|nr:aldehyde dehydrogenase [Candidatus Eremiobacteraeota bacterium]
MIPDETIAGPPSTTQLWIDGAYADAADGATYEDVDPASGEAFARIARGGAADVARAVGAARRAFDDGPWPRTTAAERAKVLRTLAALLLEHREELARLESRDAGKPFRETADRDVPRAADNCAFFASAVEQREQSAFFDRKPFLGEQREIASIVREEPVGVCALLTPWNSPLMQATWKIAPAIAAGNTCVLKPSELTPLSTLRLAELCAQAGVPDGVVNVVTGFGPEAGAPLVADPRVDAVAFTGSEPTGIAINLAAAPTLKKVTLELGGKSANVVCDDADLELAVEGSVLAMFRHSGQVCLAGTRLYVQHKIYDRFLERYLERVRNLRVGDPQSRESDLGPLITAGHRERVERFCAQADDEGVPALLRGRRPDEASLAAGNYLGPTIFAPRDESQAVAREEVFGPVLSVFRFETLDEVVARANATRYGLSSYVWTASIANGLRFAERVRAGMCWINGYFLRDLRQPFGGVRMSGLGREGGRWSLDFFTEPKLVCISY